MHSPHKGELSSLRLHSTLLSFDLTLFVFVYFCSLSMRFVFFLSAIYVASMFIGVLLTAEELLGECVEARTGCKVYSVWL